ncbi:MAG: hypothetical protein J3R72DRAFT_440833 [Linnemannia gamsii]|nr:MAG: hypothetical protein J3R72DRAFT_454874 [Linnemannia gamsii]KAK3840823.1 MAG: hypothetical protein J3R72DRAFT_446455 [Linnemannia gamsii]KAK3841619.1 MAG: hypothetical protein J3R72DRAFT_444600 [Linnemannia gamsii]KAK3843433.1 MAG: hypothetical protein J3R72DRAFT_440833 [Linnemannia gamsii]
MAGTTAGAGALTGITRRVGLMEIHSTHSSSPGTDTSNRHSISFYAAATLSIAGNVTTRACTPFVQVDLHLTHLLYFYGYLRCCPFSQTRHTKPKVKVKFHQQRHIGPLERKQGLAKTSSVLLVPPSRQLLQRKGLGQEGRVMVALSVEGEVWCCCRCWLFVG